MSYLKLYVIELEGGKVFLHLSPPIYEAFLFQECIVLFGFVKTHRPLRILKEINIDEVLEINYYVKYYMRYYGVNNVRGGNYTDEVLSKDTLRYLNDELKTTFADYEKNITIFEDIIQKYQSHPMSIENKEELEKDMKKYRKKKEFVAYIFQTPCYEDIANFGMFSEIVQDVEWLKENIIHIKLNYNSFIEEHKAQNTSSNIRKVPSFVNADDKDRYKKIIDKLKFLINIYFKLTIENLEESEYLDAYLRIKLEGLKKYESDTFTYVHIKKPVYVLDYFFLHPHFVGDWNNFLGVGESLLDEFSYMAYAVHNLCTELMYDLSSYPEDYETIARYTLDYYDIGSIASEDNV